MWYYFYSHSVCWYKVIHLSQISSVWVVKVKIELTLHCGPTSSPISKMISQANINRAIPVQIWQLHHHTDFYLPFRVLTMILPVFENVPIHWLSIRSTCVFSTTTKEQQFLKCQKTFALKDLVHLQNLACKNWNSDVYNRTFFWVRRQLYNLYEVWK